MRAGIDLVTVVDVEDSVRRFGDRYLRRVYTASELRDSRRGGQLDPARLAARFAAKEATVKVLRRAVPWRSVEVRRTDGGAVELALHDEAATTASGAGLDAFSVSLSHERDYAVAVVTADVAGMVG